MKTSEARRAPHQQPRQRRRRGPVLLAMLIGLGGGLLASMPLADWLSGTALPENPRITNPFAAWSGIGDQNILVLGTDASGANTDVIATLRINGGITSITQVPRDTYIDPEGYRPTKVNALYALGGTELLERELSFKMGRPITHHVVVNLNAISRISDALGGIEVDVPKRMRYTDRSQGLSIDLQPGPQLLRGNDLEGFLRFRHDEWGDIGRIERQQLALKALFRKLTRPENLVRLPMLLAAGGNDVKTNLGPMELGGLITAMGSTELKTERLGGRPFMLDGISYWEADWPRPAGEGDGSFDNNYVY
ncbi:cell envelope-related transcriptional attenuator domain-containing protein [Cyanobium sp. NS01]|nr:cell envelope-related transcriptional attenuator domain-containing protein [Cyanobium sp. NS01]